MGTRRVPGLWGERGKAAAAGSLLWNGSGLRAWGWLLPPWVTCDD